MDGRLVLGVHRRCARRGRDADRARRHSEAARRRLARARRAPRSTTARRRGRSITSQTPGRLHPAEVFRALRPYRRARSRHGADLRRRRVRPMGPEHAAGPPPHDQRRRRLDRRLAVVRAARRGWPSRRRRSSPCWATARSASIIAEFETAVRRNLPFVAMLGNDALLERREPDPAARLRRRAHARLRSPARALRPGGGGARRPRRAWSSAPRICRARSSARSPAASPPASTS